MKALPRFVLAGLAPVAAIIIASVSAWPAVRWGALAALPIVLVASSLAGPARDVRSALSAHLAALAVRVVGAVIGAVVLTRLLANDAPAAIATLGLGLLAGLVIDTWAVWNTADREPLHA